MDKTYSHLCIKCSDKYSDNDEDAYYCSPCKDEKNAIAKKIDANRPVSDKKAPSFNEKMAGMQTMRGITMINLPNKNG